MKYEHLCCRLCRVPVDGMNEGVFKCPNCRAEGGYEMVKTFCED